MDQSSRLSGDEWQSWATQLLLCHYAKGDFQHVPDTDRGDAGIEGYTVDGRVYQMYGPEGDLTFSKRHQKLRDKMTRDVEKFISDKNGKLSTLFGSTKIKRWILFVPAFDSKEIVEHAAKKTKEILTANLPYVDSQDFKVMVLGEDAFATESAQLLRHTVKGIDISTESVCDKDIDGWSEDDDNAYKVQHLATKTAKMPTLVTEPKRVKFEREVIKWWLEGQNVLEALRAYPETWEAIRHAKSEQEKYLRGRCMITDQQPGPLLMEALANIESTFEQEAGALAMSTRRAVAYEAVADWLMRCPLDFPEAVSNEQD